MSKELFYLPASLEAQVDDNIRTAHEKLAAMSLDDIEKRMPQAVDPDMTLGSAGYVDLSPKEAEQRMVIAMPFPFGNGWAKHMAIRAFMSQDSLNEPTRFILFPNDKDSYNLSPEQLEQLKAGDFNPIALAQLASLGRLGIEKVHYVGYSQGATVGAAALKLAAKHGMFELGANGLFEPANVADTTTGDLRGRFMKSGKGLNKAVNDSAIPALSEVQHTRGGIDEIRKNLGFISVGINSLSAVSKAIHRGFTHPYFLRDLGEAIKSDEDIKVLVAGAYDSLITPAEFMADVQELSWETPQLSARIVEGYGHELGDNVVAHAILGKLSLQQ